MSEGEAVAYVLQGKINVFLNDQKHILESEDSVKNPAYMKHKWENSFEEYASHPF